MEKIWNHTVEYIEPESYSICKVQMFTLLNFKMRNVVDFNS